jgi:two-component system, chemotaxis family, CheB/CheR fusion protein
VTAAPHQNGDPSLDALLAYLKEDHGVDLTTYKPTSLRRRIGKRMGSIGLDDFGHYVEYIREHVDEITPLLDAVLINVTAFFRDPEAWELVDAEIVPRILEARAPDLPVRIWSAGCATGQEPFTAAMIFAEAMGLEAFTRRVKIYATDLDEDALSRARRARYLLSELDAVPAPLRDRYFERDNGTARLNHAIRRAVIFGRHELVEDAPISRVDLLICRNTLMCFNVETQARILRRLHFALSDQGFLFLGRAELLLSHGDRFAPMDLRHRVFTKLPSDGRRDDRAFLAAPAARGPKIEVGRHARLREAALDASPAAQIVLDHRGRVALVNERARMMFHLGPPDLERPFQDLEVSYRPLDLRTMIDEAHEQRRPVRQENVERRLGGESQYLDVVVTPMFREGELLATIVTLSDVTHHHTLQENLQRFSENLETAYEELQSANEELETTNEELQSANEELETTNEELQAANEEMETVNEELRSTNDELSSTNDRLREREDQLRRTNALLNAVLGTLRTGMAVVSPDLRIRVWNEPAEELWGLRSDEVLGKCLTGLDIGLPVRELVDPVQKCLQGGEGVSELELAAINRRGRAFTCVVRIQALPKEAQESPAACVLMEEAAVIAP